MDKWMEFDLALKVELAKLEADELEDRRRKHCYACCTFCGREWCPYSDKPRILDRPERRKPQS